MRYRFTAGLLTVALAASMFALGAPRAGASSKGRRNTAIGLGAVALYQLLRGQTGTGLLAGAGAAYAYKKYNDARKNERRYRRSSRSSYRGYNSGYYGGSGYSYPPVGYYGNNGSQYPRGGSYTTDEWGNRHYYDPRSSDGYRRYGVAYYEPGYRTAGYRSGYSQGENCPPRRHHRRYRD